MNKLSDGDIKGSIRVLSFEEVIAPYNMATLEALIRKHSKRADTDDIDNGTDDGDTIFETAQVSRAEIIEGIQYFDNGSAGGIDGLRPQHLKDLVAQNNGHLADKLTDALGHLTTIIISGEIPTNIRPILFGANLTALLKKDGGIRPIAVGNTIRRLSAKVSCNRIREEAAKYLCPRQHFFTSLLTWVESWARRYEVGATTYYHKVTIDLPLETKSYQWVKLKKEVRKHRVGDFYMVPASPENTLKD